MIADVVDPAVSWLAGGAGSILGWTLVHSIWQAALVAAGLALLLRIVPVAMTRLRVAAASGALLVVLGLAAATWLALHTDWREHDACWSSRVHASAHPTACASHGVRLVVPGESGYDDAKTRAVHGWAWISLDDVPFVVDAAPYALAATRGTSAVVIVWGVLALAAVVRLLLGLRRLRRVLRRSRRTADSRHTALLRRIGQTMGVRRPVHLYETAEVAAPSVAGWRRPVVLVPPGTADVLDPAQLACVLSHEMVHVRRRHFLANLGQRALECLFVCNPFCRWIAGRVREEREALCDDVATGSRNGSRRRYAETLLQLEALRTPAEPALIGILGDGPLLRRVRRLATAPPPEPRARLRRAAAAIATVAIVAFVGHVTLSATALTSWAIMAHDIDVRTAPASASRIAGPTPDLDP